MPENEWVLALNSGFEISGETIEQDEIDLVRNLAGGHPFLTQLMGNILWDSRREKWSRQQIIERYSVESEPIMQTLWNSLHSEDKKIIQELLGTISFSDEVSRRESRKRTLIMRGVLKDDGSVFCKAFEEYVRSGS